MPLNRPCPECGAELAYANLAGYERATLANSICRRCAASPAVVQRRFAKAETSRAAEKGDKIPFAGFFDRLEASLSGSRGR